MSERQRKILRDMTQDAEAAGLYEQHEPPIDPHATPAAEIEHLMGHLEEEHEAMLDWQRRYLAEADETKRLRQSLEDAAEDIRLLPVGWHILMPIVHKIDRALAPE